MVSLKFATLAALASVASASWHGHATWYTPNGGIGACGAPSKNSDYVVALGDKHYLGGKNCWRHIGVLYKGEVIDATVVDRCAGCKEDHIDLSSGAFKHIADLDVGEMMVYWWYQ